MRHRCYATFPKTEKKRERKRQRADRAGVGEKSQRRVADYPLHRLSNQPVFQTEIPPTASVQRTDRAKKKALLSSKLHGGVDEHSEASTRRGTRATSAEVVRSYRAGGRPNCEKKRIGRNQLWLDAVDACTRPLRGGRCPSAEERSDVSTRAQCRGQGATPPPMVCGAELGDDHVDLITFS